MTSSRAIRAAGAFVEITARDKQLKRTLAEDKKQLRDFAKKAALIGSFAILAAAGAATNAASVMEEQLNKFNVVFAENSAAVRQWADQFAADVGRSQRQIVEFVAATQDLLVPAGIDPAAAEAMSKQLTALAVDVASFNNKLDSDVLRDFHSALTGGGETVKKYGVILNVATTNAELLAQGINPKTATDAQKVYARLAVLMKGTTAAQGDAVRSGGSLANQLKRLQGNAEDLAIAAGTALLPVAAQLVDILNNVVVPVSKWVAENPRLVQGLTAVAAGIVAVAVATKVASAAMAIYARRAVIVQALSGPAGWVAIGAAVTVAGVALANIDDQLSGTQNGLQQTTDDVAELTDKLDDLAGLGKVDVGDIVGKKSAALAQRKRDLERVTELTRIYQRRQAELAANTAEVTGLMENEKTAAERLADKLDVLAKRQRILERIRGGGGRDDRAFNDEDLDRLRDRLIDAATGFGGEMQKVRDEIGLLNGSLTETEIKLRKMSEQGVPADKVAEMRRGLEQLADAQQRNEAAQEKQREQEDLAATKSQQRDDRKTRADEIRDLFKTPTERFAEIVEEIRAVVRDPDAGLDKATATKFLEQERERLLGGVSAAKQKQESDAARIRKANSQDLRSAAGQSLLANVLNKTGDVELNQLRTLVRLEQLQNRMVSLTETGPRKARV